jgi:MFS family permease
MLIPMMLGVTATSLIGGFIMTRTGRYKAMPIIGSAIMSVAMFLLTGLHDNTSRLHSAIFFVILGIGMGFLMQITSVIVQNSVEPRDIGVASSARTFFQQIGGSLGVALLGAVFARRLTDSMTAKLPGVHLNAAGGQLDPTVVNHLPGPVKHDVFSAIATAIDGVFWWTVPAAVLLFVLAWFIKEVPLRGRAPTADTEAGELEYAAGAG